MRQIDVYFPPRKREFRIATPSRVHEGTIYIQNLSYKVGAMAHDGILLGGRAIARLLRMADARGGIKLGAKAESAGKRVSLAGRVGARLGESGVLTARKAARMRDGIALHVSARDVKEAVVRKAESGIALGALAADVKKRSAAAIQNGVRLGQRGFAQKKSSAAGKSGVQIGALSGGLPYIRDGRARALFGMRLGARSSGDVVLRILRPLLDLDDRGLSEIDDMTLGELDYYLSDE